MEAALSKDGRSDAESSTPVELSPLSDERLRIVARVLAKVLVVRALVEIGILPPE